MAKGARPPELIRRGPYQIIHDVDADAVYRALTESEALRVWFAENAEVALAGGRYEFWGRYTPGGNRPRQRLRSFTPGRELCFAWSPDGIDREVTISIGPAAFGIEVQVLSSPEDEYKSLIDRFWRRALENLANHLQGQRLNPRFDYTDQTTEVRIQVIVDTRAINVWQWLIQTPDSNSRPEPRVLRTEQGRYWIGWHRRTLRFIEEECTELQVFSWEHLRTVSPPMVLTIDWDEDEPPSTVLCWEIEATIDGKATVVTLTHRGFDDSEVAARYREKWHETVIHLKRVRTRR